MQIFVRLPSGETLTMNGNDTVETLWAMIQERVGIPPDEQRFVFGGLALTLTEGDKTLADYNIPDNAFVHMLLRLRGNGGASVADDDEGLLPSVVSHFQIPGITAVDDNIGPIPLEADTPAQPDLVPVVRFRLARPGFGCIRLKSNDDSIIFKFSPTPRLVKVHDVTGAVLDVPVEPAAEDATPADYIAYLRRVVGETLGLAEAARGPLEVRRASGAWAVLDSPETVLHRANTRNLRMQALMRVVVLPSVLRPDGTAGDCDREVYDYLPRAPSLKQVKALLGRHGVDGTPCVVQDGPEHGAVPHRLLALNSDADVAATVGDGATIAAASGSSAQLLPAAATVSPSHVTTAPFGALTGDSPRNSDGTAKEWAIVESIANLDTPAVLARFKRYGFLMVAVPDERLTRAMDFARDIFEKVPVRGAAGKRAAAMGPDERVWGWHAMAPKCTEVLKLRAVPTFSAKWPAVPTAAPQRRARETEDDAAPTVRWLPPARQLLASCVMPFRDVGNDVAVRLMRGLGVAESVTKTAIAGPAGPMAAADEFAAPFFEAFRYGSGYRGWHGDAVVGSAAAPVTCAVPCEPRKAVGMIGVALIPSLTGTHRHGIVRGGATGLQLSDVTNPSLWYDVERVEHSSPDTTLVAVFAGEMMEYASRGTVPAPAHRVVVAHGAAPRYSCIYEVLPHPASVVPRVPPPAGAAAPRDDGMASRDVCVLRSVDRPRVNW